MVSAFFFLLSLGGGILKHVTGQFGPNLNGKCLVDTWTLNSLNQTPCEVSANLTSECPLNFAAPIEPGFPTSKSTCLCNTVIFALISACNACQNITFPGPPVSWGRWLSGNDCKFENASLGTAPNISIPPNSIPSGIQVAIPAWAYQTFDHSTTWDANKTEALHKANETEILLGEATSSTSGSPSSSSTSGATPQSSPDSVSSNSRSNTPTIVGAVIGGLGVLSILLLAFVLCRRHEAKQTRRPRYLSPARDTYTKPTQSGWRESNATNNSESGYAVSNDIPMETRTRFTATPSVSPIPASPPPLPIALPVAKPPIPDYIPSDSFRSDASRKSVAMSLSRASTVSRNPFFQLAAADGSLSIEGHTPQHPGGTTSKYPAVHYESFI